jgi:hypothetical protein
LPNAPGRRQVPPRVRGTRAAAVRMHDDERHRDHRPLSVDHCASRPGVAVATDPDSEVREAQRTAHRLYLMAETISAISFHWEHAAHWPRGPRSGRSRVPGRSWRGCARLPRRKTTSPDGTNGGRLRRSKPTSSQPQDTRFLPVAEPEVRRPRRPWLVVRVTFEHRETSTSHEEKEPGSLLKTIDTRIDIT